MIGGRFETLTLLDADVTEMDALINTFNIARALHKICNKIWKTGEWPIPWTQSLIITLPKKGNLQQLERAIAQSAQCATQVKSC